jgi:sialidase-2/3/4
MGNTSSRSYLPGIEMQPAKTTLFKQEQTGTRYRIPALIYLKESQTFLAFAEKRSSLSDSDAKSIVMRRGTQQNGSTQVNVPSKSKHITVIIHS